MRRNLRGPSAPLAALAALLASLPSCTPAAATFDVVVYGATPSGIAAALAVAREGRRAALVHPLARIGGMMTGGLGMTDVGEARVLLGRVGGRVEPRDAVGPVDEDQAGGDARGR